MSGEGFASNPTYEVQSDAQALSRGFRGLAGMTTAPKCVAMSR